jgi:hypothetical protein
MNKKNKNTNTFENCYVSEHLELPTFATPISIHQAAKYDNAKISQKIKTIEYNSHSNSATTTKQIQNSNSNILDNDRVGNHKSLVKFILQWRNENVATDDPKLEFWLNEIAPSCVYSHVSNDDNKYFQCVICTMPCSISNNLIRHYREKHFHSLPYGIFGEESVFSCVLCLCDFKRQEHYKRHLASSEHQKQVKMDAIIKSNTIEHFVSSKKSSLSLNELKKNAKELDKKLFSLDYISTHNQENLIKKKVDVLVKAEECEEAGNAAEDESEEEEEEHEEKVKCNYNKEENQKESIIESDELVFDLSNITLI